MDVKQSASKIDRITLICTNSLVFTASKRKNSGAVKKN
jgi:hypothetical protein